MNIQDAIAYIETEFTCEPGAPWRWADLAMTKPYQTVSFDIDVPVLQMDDVEHRLVARLITSIGKIKRDAGFRREQRPKLFWRWNDKVRIADDVITTRIYVDGNPGMMSGNPSKPRGRPTVGQMRIAA